MDAQNVDESVKSKAPASPPASSVVSNQNNSHHATDSARPKSKSLPSASNKGHGDSKPVSAPSTAAGDEDAVGEANSEAETILLDNGVPSPVKSRKGKQ